MAALKVLLVVIFGFLAKVTNGVRVASTKLEQDRRRRNGFSPDIRAGSRMNHARRRRGARRAMLRLSADSGDGLFNSLRDMAGQFLGCKPRACRKGGFLPRNPPFAN